jgi:hypothetical protein
MDTVADVLVTRAPEPTGLRRMFAISIVGHIVLSIAFLLMPSPAPTTDDPEVAIELSLGGAPGPRVGGMTTMGGRAIQEVAKEPNKPQPITPPAAKTPEMTLPTVSDISKADDRRRDPSREHEGRDARSRDRDRTDDGR